jgi:hypothetical protein
MKRSAGVTASAVIVLLGSALVLLLAGFGVLGIAVAPVRETQFHYMKYFMWFFIASLVAMAGWGIASGVGLVQLRNWARISILVFGGLLLFVGLPNLLIIPFIPLQQPTDLPDTFALGVRIFLVAFFGMMAGVGMWWVVFFNRKAVRAQFQGVFSESQQLLGTPARPISITIIGWYLIVGGFICLPFLFLHMPVFLLGFMLRGWASSLFMLGSGILQLVAGAGLLKLKPWSRSLAIGTFSFIALNAVLMVVLPGSQARYEQTMKSIQEAYGTPPTTMHFPIWFGLAFCLPLFAVLLWFLVANRKAFLPANQNPASLG